MRLPARRAALLALLACTPACKILWESSAGTQTLAEEQVPRPRPRVDGPDTPDVLFQPAAALRLSFVLPKGWHWILRGSDLVATRDGAFLQNIIIERIRVGTTTQDLGPDWTSRFVMSSRQWPLRTAKYLQTRFQAGMSPEQAALALLDSRAHDRSLLEFEPSETLVTSLAGQAAFRAQFEFRLDPHGNPEPEWEPYSWPKYSIQERATPYRSVYCGFVHGEWFYGICYTAARRCYFERDVSAFEAFLNTIKLLEPDPSANERK